MAAPAAPVVVEGGALAAITGALILSVMIWASLLGLQKFYDYTFGALLSLLANLVDKAVPFYDVGEATIGKLNQKVQESIGTALTQAERNVARTWHGLTWVVRETGETMELFAHATVEAIHSLTNGEIPAQIRSNVVPTVVKVTKVQNIYKTSLAGIRADLHAAVRDIETDLARTFGLARHGIDAIKGVDLPALNARIAAVAAGTIALGKYAHGSLDRRIGRLETKIAGATLAAGVLAVIARYAPWVRCSNVGRLGRAVCRTDRNFLDSLLGLSLLVVGSLSLEQMARELREPTSLVMDGVEGFVRELRELS